MYEQWIFSVIAYNGAVDHIFSVYRMYNGEYKITLDGAFYSNVGSRVAAYDEIEAAVDEMGWIFMED